VLRLQLGYRIEGRHPVEVIYSRLVGAAVGALIAVAMDCDLGLRSLGRREAGLGTVQMWGPHLRLPPSARNGIRAADLARARRAADEAAGLFMATDRLTHWEDLPAPDRRELRRLRRWFSDNFRIPTRLRRSRKPHRTDRAISWFRESATSTSPWRTNSSPCWSGTASAFSGCERAAPATSCTRTTSRSCPSRSTTRIDARDPTKQSSRNEVERLRQVLVGAKVAPHLAVTRLESHAPRTRDRRTARPRVPEPQPRGPPPVAARPSLVQVRP
jgi:hypothetical protein